MCTVDELRACAFCLQFTSADGYSWLYGGVVANWTDVRTVPGGSEEYGPSESDIVLLGDEKTLLSVVRMDGDSGCFPPSVPPSSRTRVNTVYRNYAASYSEDNGAPAVPRHYAVDFCTCNDRACASDPLGLTCAACTCIGPNRCDMELPQTHRRRWLRPSSTAQA